MSLPTLFGTGRLVEDPELRYTPTGLAVCKVRLAFSSRKKSQQTGEWEDGERFFVDGEVWRDLAEHVANSLTKGAEVVVSGRLRTRQYETGKGEKRSVVELLIDSIGPTLAYADVVVKKMTRTKAADAAADTAPTWAASPPPSWATAEPSTDTPPY